MTSSDDSDDKPKPKPNPRKKPGIRKSPAVLSAVGAEEAGGRAAAARPLRLRRSEKNVGKPFAGRLPERSGL